MTATSSVFKVEREDQILIIIPATDLRELEFQEIEFEGDELLELLEDETLRNVIVDFGATDYFGSTALGVFLKVWERVRERGGRMVFCNLSDHEWEILEVAGLAGLWPRCSSREEAQQLVGTSKGEIR
jgi:anti-anti-sigma factor